MNEESVNEESVNEIDFNQVKAEANVLTVLEYYNIRLKENGRELVGWCPFGSHGKDDSFSFNPHKKVFQCFSCHKRGSVLDFVREMEKVGIKKAGRVLHSINAGKPPLMAQDNEQSKPNGETHYPKKDQEAALGSIGGKLPVLTIKELAKKLKDKEIRPSDVLILDMSKYNFIQQTG